MCVKTQLILTAGLMLAVATPVFAQTAPSNRFDLNLSQAFERADQFNPQITATRRTLNLSQADITIAGASPNPFIGVQYGFGNIYSQQGNAQQVGINQVFELGGKRAARLGVADAQYSLTRLQLDALRWQIRSQVRRAYAELAAAEANARSIDAQTELLQRLVDIARKRFEAGAAPQAELLQVQLARIQIDPQRTQATGRIQQARIQLGSLLGNTDREPDIVANDQGLFSLSVEKTELAPAPDTQLPSPDALLARAYSQRLDLLATQQQTEVARQQLNLAQAQRTPDLQVSGGYLFTSFTNGIQQADGFYTGVGVTLPFVYNQQGEVERAEQSITQSGLQVAAVRAQIAAEVNAAYQSLAVSRENIRKYQTQLLPASLDVLQLAQESYQVGKTGLNTAILAQQANQQVRSGYLDAIVAYQNAWSDLERAVGQPISL